MFCSCIKLVSAILMIIVSTRTTNVQQVVRGRSESKLLCHHNKTPGSEPNAFGNCSSEYVSDCYVNTCSKDNIDIDLKQATTPIDSEDWSKCNIRDIGAYQWISDEVVHMNPEPALIIKFNISYESKPDVILMNLVPYRDGKMRDSVCDKIDLSRSTWKISNYSMTIDYDCFTGINFHFTSEYLVYILDIAQKYNNNWSKNSYLIFTPSNTSTLTTNIVAMFQPMIVINFVLLNFGKVHFYFHPMLLKNIYRVYLVDDKAENEVMREDYFVNEGIGPVLVKFDGIQSGSYHIKIKVMQSCESSNHCITKFPPFTISNEVENQPNLLIIILCISIIICITIASCILFLKKRRIYESGFQKNVLIMHEPDLKSGIVGHLKKNWLDCYESKLDVTIEATVRTNDFSAWLRLNLNDFDVIIIFVHDKFSSDRTARSSTKYANAYSKTVNYISSEPKLQEKVHVFFFGTDMLGCCYDRNLKVKKHHFGIANVSHDYSILEELRFCVQHELRHRIPFQRWDNKGISVFPCKICLIKQNQRILLVDR